MAKKVNKVPRFFRASPDDPIGGILTTAGNIAADQILRVFSNQLARQFFGAPDRSPEEQFRSDSYRVLIQKQESELAKAQTQQLKAAQQLKLIEYKIAEKELQLEKARQESNTVSFERTEVDLHIKTEIISGALQSVANSEGLSGSFEQQETVKEWQDSLIGKVINILGKRGGGKTATGLTFCEFLAATYGLLVYWVGVPAWAQKLLPNWFRIVDSLDKCPNDCVIFIDETGSQFLSLQFANKRNTDLRQQLMLCRQRNQTLIFCAQHSRDIDESIIRQSSCTVFKEPSLQQADSERYEIKPKAIKATQAFKQIPKGERPGVAYIFDSNFEGLIKCSLPSFWAEEISTIYGRSGGSVSANQRNDRPHGSGVNEPKLPGAVVSDEEILTFRKKGYGYEKIAKTLGCSLYRVRQCLVGHDPLDPS